jgi:hypothetical protein
VSITFTKIAYLALRDIGCLRPGQTGAPDALADILAMGNQMLDSWQLDRLLLLCDRIDAYTLTGMQQTYTIGPLEISPNFGAARPVSIRDAVLVLNTVTPFVRIPMEVINVDDWESIAVQDLPGALPLRLYYDKSFNSVSGASRLKIWPGPLQNYGLELVTPQQLTQFADLTTQYIFPPGYQRLIQKNLAVEIAPMMDIYCKLYGLAKPRAPMLALVTRQAAEAMDAVKFDNAPAPKLSGDPAYGGGTRGGWNYAIGENNTGGRS